MADIYKSDKVVKTKKGWQVVTKKGDYPECIDLQEFYSYYPENTKGVNIVANSTWTGYDNYSEIKRTRFGFFLWWALML